MHVQKPATNVVVSESYTPGRNKISQPITKSCVIKWQLLADGEQATTKVTVIYYMYTNNFGRPLLPGMA